MANGFTPPPGGRKFVLTKWMLIIFTFGTAGYMFSQAGQLPDSFYMNFVLGLGMIGGAFTAGNIFEHRAKANISTSLARAKVAEAKGVERGAANTQAALKRRMQTEAALLEDAAG